MWVCCLEVDTAGDKAIVQIAGWKNLAVRKQFFASSDGLLIDDRSLVARRQLGIDAEVGIDLSQGLVAYLATSEDGSTPELI